jgi:hypothetical protein
MSIARVKLSYIPQQSKFQEYDPGIEINVFQPTHHMIAAFYRKMEAEPASETLFSA